MGVECRQCGVMPMIPPEDDRCPMCGCEEAFGLNEMPILNTIYKAIREQEQKMEREELLKEWADKLIFSSPLSGHYDKDWVIKVLGDVFEVGRQTGIDEEKLRIQLEQLGKPHGYGTNPTWPKV